MPAPTRSSRPVRPRVALAILSASALAVASCSGKAPPPRAAKRSIDAYDQGKYSEALPVLLKAFDSGRRDGTLLYQIGYCRLVVEKKDDERKAAWREAEPLLEREVAASHGAT